MYINSEITFSVSIIIGGNECLNECKYDSLSISRTLIDNLKLIYDLIFKIGLYTCVDYFSLMIPFECHSVAASRGSMHFL